MNRYQIYLFADNTKIYKQVEGRRLQEDPNTFIAWSNKWLLKFHPQKCKVLEVSTTVKKKYEYKIQNTSLEHASSEKDIGVIIDQNLTFQDHI